MLGADELVLHPLRFVSSRVHDCRQALGKGGGGAAVGVGQRGGRPRSAGDRCRVHAHLAEDLWHDALGLFGKRGQQVLGLDLRVVHLARQLLRADESLLRLLGELVQVHACRFCTTLRNVS
jgi:hypothetical protein